MKSAREECGRACVPGKANGEQHDFGALPTAMALAEVALTMKSPAGGARLHTLAGAGLAQGSGRP
jgi:hypothetical protein